MAVDKAGPSLVHLGEFYHTANRIGPQAHTGDRFPLDHFQPGGPQVKPAAGGGVIKVEDGENPIENRSGQQGECSNSCQDTEGKQFSLPKEHIDHCGDSKPYPTGTAIGHAEADSANQKHAGSQNTAEPVPGGENKGHNNWERQQQEEGQGVGVFIKRVDPTGHVCVHRGIRKGGVDPDADDHVLENTVAAADEGPQRQTAADAQQLLAVGGAVDQSYYNHHARNVIDQIPGGQVDKVRQRHSQDGSGGKADGIGPDGLQGQGALPGVHAAKIEQHQHQTGDDQTVGVVPVLVGDGHDEGDEPAGSNCGLTPSLEGQRGEEAPLQGSFQPPVEPPEESERQIQHPFQAAAGGAVSPSAGETPLVIEQVDQKAALPLAVEPCAEAVHPMAQQALLIDMLQPMPEGEAEAAKKTVLCVGHGIPSLIAVFHAVQSGQQEIVPAAQQIRHDLLVVSIFANNISPFFTLKFALDGLSL